MKEKEENGAYSAPALDKGLDILEVLSKCENGLTQQEQSMIQTYLLVRQLCSKW